MRAVLYYPVFADSLHSTTRHKIVTGLSDMPLALELEALTYDINAVDCFGDTPLHWAVRRDNIGAFGLLLGAKASPNITGRWERSATPLRCEGSKSSINQSAYR